MTVFSPEGEVKQSISLAESGSMAHYRLMKELAPKPDPQMQLATREVVHVVDVCTEAVRLGGLNVQPSYRFGESPVWLDESAPRRVIVHNGHRATSRQ